MIDIVDESDEIIGQKERDLVHKDGDWHRVAHVWVFNSKGEVLCHKRAKAKKLFPGLWDVIIGGHLDSGESYEKAAIRELKEEVDIETDIDNLVELGMWKGVANPTEPNNRECVKIFAFKYDGVIESLRPEEKEISELEFISFDKLKEIANDEKEREKFVSFVYMKNIIDKLESL